MNIWLISLFDPAPVENSDRGRYLGIASAAIKADHQVTYFSSTFKHATKVQRFESTHVDRISATYEVVYVYSVPYQRNISLRRLYSHHLYTVEMRQEMKKRATPDVIMLAYPPISTSYWVVRWAKKLKIPVVIDVIDPWPDVFIKLIPGVFKALMKLAILPLSIRNRTVLKNCTGVTAISSEYVDWAKKQNPFLEKTGVFFPGVPFQAMRAKIDIHQGTSRTEDGRIRLIYAGSLGVSYDIPTILKAAEVLDWKHPGESVFMIAGAGQYQNIVLDYQERLDNVVFLGRLEHSDLLKEYASADIGLAQYPVGATQSVTYKFFDYLSAGLVILNSLMTEMARLTEEYKVGINNPPGDAEKLVENIEVFMNDTQLLREYKQNAIELASSRGDSDKVYKELVGFLECIKP